MLTFKDLNWKPLAYQSHDWCPQHLVTFVTHQQALLTCGGHRSQAGLPVLPSFLARCADGNNDRKGLLKAGHLHHCIACVKGLTKVCPEETETFCPGRKICGQKAELNFAPNSRANLRVLLTNPCLASQAVDSCEQNVSVLRFSQKSLQGVLMDSFSMP